MRSFAVFPVILATVFAGQDQTQVRRRHLQGDEPPQQPYYSYEEGRWIMPPPVVHVDFSVDPDWVPDLGEEADYSTTLVVVPPPEDEPVEPQEDEILEEEGEEEEGPRQPPFRFNDEPTPSPSLLPSDAPSMVPSDAPSSVPV